MFRVLLTVLSLFSAKGVERIDTKRWPAVCRTATTVTCIFVVCMDGPGEEVEGRICTRRDLDLDGDVDLRDWAIVQADWE